MANMSFGVNIIPKQNNTYTLGNSDYKWNIFANTINGTSVATAFLPTVSTTDNDKILQVSSGAWQVVTSPYAPIDSPAFLNSVSLGRSTGTTVGANSVALGNGVTATGLYSFAQGTSTEASGQASHAEGSGTLASGNASHAEGSSGTVGSGANAYRAAAVGQYSHVEGHSTYASGTAGHAEGGLTKSTGIYAHAEGDTTQANGSNSHAEGSSTIAQASSTHAEGGGGTFTLNGTTITSGAYDNYAHSEGDKTCAYGYSSHSEGAHTYAQRNYSHAEGYETIANGYYSHAEGENTTVTGDAGHVEGRANTSSSDYAHAEGYGTTASGQGSHSEGVGTTASGYSAHAEGTGNTASGAYSHAEGQQTIASGSTSHAEGTGGTYTLNSTSMVSGAKGEGSHAEGYQTIAGSSSTVGDHAEGYQTQAVGGMGSHAEGSGGTYTKNNVVYTSGALGISDHTEGYRTRTASAKPGNHAEGYCTAATGGAAHSEGSETLASGMDSHSEGNNSIASDVAAHAEGYYTNAKGSYSHSEGQNTSANSTSAHAEGQYTNANGACSHVEGYYTTAAGAMSHVTGLYNAIDSYSSWPSWQASTEYSVGDRVKYTTSVNNESVIKGYVCSTAHTSGSTFSTTNWNSDNKMNYAVIVGNGTSGLNRVNAYALDWSGNAFFAGNVYTGANGDSTGGNKLATEAYVTTAIANAGGGSGSSTPSNLATVATTGDYGDLINKPDLSQYITAVPSMTGCSSSAAGASGLVPAPAAGNEDQFLSGDGTWKSGGLPMVILSYGNSTWAQFEAAYKNNVIVYCRASSNSNPASGSQTRMAFMAYVNDATNPANVEFQYYRSVNTHSSTQMGDQVFVYKLDKTSGWSVTTREASIKQISIDTNNAGSVAWSSNKVTLTTGLPKVSASDNGKILQVVNGVWTAVTPS